MRRGEELWGRECFKTVQNTSKNIRLATSRLANIFGNGTMYRHDKNLKRAKPPEINQTIYAGRTRTGRNRAKDFAKV